MMTDRTRFTATPLPATAGLRVLPARQDGPAPAGAVLEAADPAPCIVCGGRDAVPMPDRSLQHLVQCPTCGLVYVRSFPTAEKLGEIYNEVYYASPASHIMGYEDYEGDQGNIVRTAHHRLDLISKLHPEPGRVLDVGCALGFFLQAAQEAGWDITGLDISPFAVSYAREALGCTVHCGELDHFSFAEDPFDVVTMWDVIEHMTDPCTQLRACHAALKDNGLLVLSTPDIGSLTAKLTGPRWMGFKLADEHLYYFSRATISRLLEDAGFEVILMRSIGKHVTLDFFLKRLDLYAEHLSTALKPLVRRAGQSQRSLYVNPGDIVSVFARKRSVTPH